MTIRTTSGISQLPQKPQLQGLQRPSAPWWSVRPQLLWAPQKPWELKDHDDHKDHNYITKIKMTTRVTMTDIVGFVLLVGVVLVTLWLFCWLWDSISCICTICAGWEYSAGCGIVLVETVVLLILWELYLLHYGGFVGCGSFSSCGVALFVIV